MASITSAPLLLTDLPVEILTLIAGSLCLHCQHAGPIVDLPEPVIDRGREEKRALAALSLTCRFLRSIAQPILFHYYHSGNQPLTAPKGKWDTAGFDHGADDDLLVPFLRSIIQRPDLSASVHAVTLFTRVFNRTAGPETNALFREAARKFGIDNEVHNDLTVEWAQELGIAATAPFVEQILISRITPLRFNYLRHFPGDFPRLTYVAITGLGKQRYNEYHFGETRPLLSRAPNLEVLIAADCGSESDRDARDFWAYQPWDITLPKLRKLSISGLDPVFLASVIAHCPALEDLELHVSFTSHPLLSSEQLRPLRPTLRRLCYSVTHRSLQTAEWKANNSADHTANVLSAFLEPAKFGPPEDRREETAVSLADFPRLEILEIEQILLYGAAAFSAEGRAERFEQEAHTGAEVLAAKLPPLLRVLHIGMAVAWKELHRDLTELARRRLSNTLREVRVDCLEPPPAEEVRSLEATMAKAGIVFSIGSTPVNAFARAMMPDRPGHTVLGHEPKVLYPL